MSILVIQTAFVGDLVLSTPLFEAARTRLGAGRVGVVVRPETANLLRNNPHIDDIVIYDKHGAQKGPLELLRLARKLRGAAYDTALIPHRSFRSAMLGFLSGISVRVGFDRSAGRLLLTDRVAYRSGHEVDRNLSLLDSWEVDAEGIRPALYPDDADRRRVDALMRQTDVAPSEPLCGISPGSVWATKRWLPGRYAALIRRLAREYGYRSVLFGSSGDRPLCDEIAAESGVDPLNAAGALTLLQSAALAARCAAVVSNDTGMGHVAAAMDTPVVALFGPTVPAFGFVPHGPGHQVVETPLDCRPCSAHGGNRCPIGTHDCMRGITVERVIEAVAIQLGKPGPPVTD
ncbi:MAG: lipopolysaccharide heptosyltransferase II [Gemmatimonadetes bacterium]|nr:lipopolysaccharide heptosyltransferase II [Gemmatimonadota bacterium]